MTKSFSVVVIALAVIVAGAALYYDFAINGSPTLPIIVSSVQQTPDPSDNPKNTPEPPANTGTIDDWKYTGGPSGDFFTLYGPKSSSQRQSVNGAPGGATGLQAPAMDSSSLMKESNIGLAVGGAKDVNNFRENIKKGFVPLPTDITYEGLFYDYFFDTGKTLECSKLFCPSYSRAVSADPYSKNPEYFMTVGLNSGIKESDFARKKLNLVVVLDISGSMGSAFDKYYYDQVGNRRKMTAAEEKEASKTKMEVATQSIAAMTKHLKGDDRFGVVLFDDDAYLAKPLSLVRNTDMEKIRKHILDISEQGSTNMEAGVEEANKLFVELEGVNQNEYENRIIFLTDAQPNTGDTSKSGFVKMVENNAKNKISMTFIGVGVDFNTQLIEAITKVRGANYYSVHSSKEFATRMDDEFDYMVTPLVFDLELAFKSKGFEIQEVYGSPEANLATGEIMKVNTLFPSKSSEKGTKGGIVLLQLKKLSEDASITLTTSYQDRSGKVGGDETTVTFGNLKPEYFENTGIRKGILLARYANVIKNWIDDERSHPEYPVLREWEPVMNDRVGIYLPRHPRPMLGQWERQSMSLRVNSAYKKLFGLFSTYFTGEMKALGDSDLQQEVDLLDKLGS